MGHERATTRVCFVCLGNICRSPTAEAILKHLVREQGLAREFAIESAGTGDWHVGELRDPRSRRVAERRGMPLSGRARQFTVDDFDRFDYVLAMDAQNLRNLRALAPDDGARAKVALLRSFEAARPEVGGPPREAAVGGRPDEPDPDGRPGDQDVPDPYQGGELGFERVFDVCLAACRELLAALRQPTPKG